MPTRDEKSADRTPAAGDASHRLRTDGGTPRNDADWRRAVATTRAVIGRIREDDVPFTAAGVAYYAVASFLPLLIVSMAVLSLVGAEDWLVDAIRGSVSGSAVDVVDEALRQTQGRGGAGTVGFLVALWSATKLFRGLSTAFDELYEGGGEDPVLAQVWQAIVLLAALLIAFVVAAGTGIVTALVPFDLPLSGLVWNLVGLVLLVVGLLPFYYVLPPIDVSVGEALPGAVVSAIGWLLLQFGFSIYARNAGTYEAYGFLGAILLFVLFCYLAALVLLVGAVVNVVHTA